MEMEMEIFLMRHAIGSRGEEAESWNGNISISVRDPVVETRSQDKEIWYFNQKPKDGKLNEVGLFCFLSCDYHPVPISKHTCHHRAEKTSSGVGAKGLRTRQANVQSEVTQFAIPKKKVWGNNSGDSIDINSINLESSRVNGLKMIPVRVQILFLFLYPLDLPN
jgi:hypothetical protein